MKNTRDGLARCFIMYRWPFGLSLLSVALRVFRLGSESLWYDECFSAWLAQLPIPNMIRATLGDVHPPLWYLIENLAVKIFGSSSEFGLRFPAMVFGVLLVWEVYHLVDSLADQRAAIGAALCVALAPGQIYYAQEARMYSLLAWLVVLGLRAAITGNWWRYMPVLGLILYTHNLGALYAGLIGLVAVFKHRRAAILPSALAGLAWLPWLVALIYQLSHVDSGFWISEQGIGAVLYYVYFVTFGVRVPVPVQVHAAILGFGLTIVTLYQLQDRRELWPLLLLAFGPPILLFVASVAWRPLMLDRVLIPAGAGLLALWGIALARLVESRRYAVLVLALPTLIAALGGYYFNQDAKKNDVRLYTSIIDSEWQPGDVIYSINLASLITTRYYLPDSPHYLLPGSNDLSQSLTDETKQAMGIEQASVDRLVAEGYRRMWLLHVDTPVIADFEIQAADNITHSYRPIKEYIMLDNQFVTFRVILLEL